MVGTLAAGALGGLLGAAAMGALMRTVRRENPLPSEVFAAQFIFDGDPLDHRYWGLAIHLLYGTLAGVVFGYLLAAYVGAVADLSVTYAIGYGGAWGLVLWILSFGWLAVLGTMERITQLSTDEQILEVFLILVGHLIYGAVLGFTTLATLAL